MSFGRSVFKRVTRKVGFTLAEVLVALTVVGIVAATVIPAVLNRINDVDSIIKYKQVVSDLTAATKKAALNGGGVIDTSTSTAILNTYGTVMNFIRRDTVINILKSDYTCYKNTSAMCIDLAIYSSDLGAILSNGVVIVLDGNFNRINCNASWGGLNNICANWGIDVNGNKGPNMEGKDFFWVWLIKKNGEYLIVPVGTNGDGTCVAGSTDYNTSDGCATNALMNNLP